MPAYDIVWNDDRGRFEVMVAGQMVGFHRLRGGAEALGARVVAKPTR
ncbi:MAG TPA: hypothetical protein VHZ78_08485 [Rhizomicrobium sp.]|nr:hypothetical protein [Rhizomicrobium sp.]